MSPFTMSPVLGDILRREKLCCNYYKDGWISLHAIYATGFNYPFYTDQWLGTCAVARVRVRTLFPDLGSGWTASVPKTNTDALR